MTTSSQQFPKHSDWFACGLSAACVLFLVGAMFHLLEPSSFASQYENESLFRPWAGWTSKYMMIHPLLVGFLFASGFLVYRRQARFPLRPAAGLGYGAGIFLVGSLPIFMLAYASFQVSANILFVWIFQNLIQYTAAGVAVGWTAEGMHLRVGVLLDRSPEQVWTAIRRKDTFLYLTRGMLDYGDSTSWPDILFSRDTVIDMTLRPFHLPLPSAHRVEVVRVDEAGRMIETKEHGGLVTDWKHVMRVEAVPGRGSWYTDSIRLKAGLLTPLLWMMAYVFYRVRQRRLCTIFARPSHDTSDT